MLWILDVVNMKWLGPQKSLPLTEHLVSPSAPHSKAGTHRFVAVVDVGTNSIRLAIAEIGPGGQVRVCENLAQGVRLGKDTFTRGEIARSTIEECVRILKTYRKKLAEFQITRPDQIRVVATSAVREATNRIAFIDRIYIATGFIVEAIDEPEVHRITYRSIKQQLDAHPEFKEARIAIAEVGGGSTELLYVDAGNVAYSHAFRLGSLRLHESLESLRATQSKLRDIMESEIQRQLESLPSQIPANRKVELIALGSDARFAAKLILKDWNPERFGIITVKQLGRFVDEFLGLSEDAMIRKYQIPFSEAETAGPALLTYLELARLLNLDQIHVSTANLRDGLLREIADGSVWSEDFRKQIVRSALELGRKYNFDEDHALQVAELSKGLFHELKSEHGFDARYELLLYVASLLHEIGLFIDTRSLHKHSLYIIMNSELFGLSSADVLQVALVTRYHRRSTPKPTHPFYNMLDRDARVSVSKMAAILRISLALNAARNGRVKHLEFQRKANTLTISIPHVDDLSIEQLSLKQNRNMFEEIYGMQVRFRAISRSEFRPGTAPER